MKSVNLVPIPIIKSAFLAISFAAELPVTPRPPKFSGFDDLIELTDQKEKIFYRNMSFAPSKIK